MATFVSAVFFFGGYRWLRSFRFDGFVLLFRVLVRADLLRVFSKS